MGKLEEKKLNNQTIEIHNNTKIIESNSNYFYNITSKLKSVILNLLGKDSDTNSLSSIVTIGEGDYISLKREYSNNIIVLGRVLKIHMKRISSNEHQIYYDIEIFRSKENTLVDVQDVFNGKQKLKLETHDMARINKSFEKIDFKTN